MQKYKDFQPTCFDPKGLNADENNISDFLVLLGQNRDSDCLTRSNFESALDILGGENDKVQIHRFGHWANGWFELILVHPDLEIEAQKIVDSLEDYPVLNENHFSELQWNEGQDYWDSLSLKDKIDYCIDANISIFAARSESVPEGLEEKIIYSN